MRGPRCRHGSAVHGLAACPSASAAFGCRGWGPRVPPLLGAAEHSLQPPSWVPPDSSAPTAPLGRRFSLGRSGGSRGTGRPKPRRLPLAYAPSGPAASACIRPPITLAPSARGRQQPSASRSATDGTPAGERKTHYRVSPGGRKAAPANEQRAMDGALTVMRFPFRPEARRRGPTRGALCSESLAAQPEPPVRCGRGVLPAPASFVPIRLLYCPRLQRHISAVGRDTQVIERGRRSCTMGALHHSQ